MDYAVSSKPLGAAAAAFVGHLQRIQQNLEAAAKDGRLPAGNPELETIQDTNAASRTYGQFIPRLPWCWLIMEVQNALGERVPSPGGPVQCVATPRPAEGVASHAARLLQAGAHRLATAAEIASAIEAGQRRQAVAAAEDRDRARRALGVFYEARLDVNQNAATLPPPAPKA
jgi:hypothetical protein